MLRKFLAAILLVLFAGFTFSNIFCQKIENNFINALVEKKNNISDFVDNEELKRSRRLGISYMDVDNKWLISFDIPDEIKTGFREGKYNYTIQTEQLEDGYSLVTLAVGAVNYLQKFYFLNNKFVSPSRYFTRNWKNWKSRYFKFRISEAKYFNDYCVKRLDDFVDSLCNLLNIDPERKGILENEKIDYTFCKDEDEVEKITGYKSKGMSVLAFDEVITAYQTHFHEVAHILINFKLQNLGLYTLPFFLEGFAVAVGGRGGMAPRVVTDLGYYLQKTDLLTYDSILTYESFYSQDANMTYAVSGLYNKFLMDLLGGEKYLELYNSVNGDIEYIRNIKPQNLRLPLHDIFFKHLQTYENNQLYNFDYTDTLKNPSIIWNAGGGFIQLDSQVMFIIRDRCYFGPKYDLHHNLYSDYTSKIYGEFEKKEMTTTPEYCVKSDSESINIYNLYNNELIFSYNKQLSLFKSFIPRYKNRSYFYINKNIFDFDLNNAYTIIDGY